jgi:bacterioferritin-associated ferredoxin
MTYVICRCEDVTDQQISDAIELGAATPQEVKFHTRAGFGFCQGRVCRGAVDSMIEAAGIPAEQQGNSMTVHLPVRPIALADLAKTEGD